MVVEMFYTMYEQNISKGILGILSEDMIISADHEKCKVAIDQFFLDRTGKRSYLLSSRVRFQKKNGNEIENVDFYQKISDVNTLLKALEQYCVEKYNIILVSTNEAGLAEEGYSENTILTPTECDKLSKLEIVKLICKEGYSSKKVDEVLTKSAFLEEEFIVIEALKNIQNMVGDWKNLNGSVLVIGSLAMKKIIDKIVTIDFEICEESFLESVNKEFVQKFQKIILVSPKRNELLKNLWKLGISIEKTVLMPRRKVFSLKNYIGEYTDVFHNHIVSKSNACRIDISGFGANADISGGIKGYIIANIGTQSTFIVKENVNAQYPSIGLLYGSVLEIGSAVRIEEKNTIRMGPFTKGKIGCNSILERDIYMLAGDGHSIFNVQTTRRTNYLCDMLETGKLEVIIGEHVWIKRGCTIICGCNIANDCVIGEKSILNKKIEENSFAYGNPLRVVQSNINWEETDWDEIE